MSLTLKAILVLNFVLIITNGCMSYRVINNTGILRTSAYACGVAYGQQAILKNIIPGIKLEPEMKGCLDHRLNAIKYGYTLSHTEKL